MLQKSSAASQDSFMESEMRFWPQHLTILGHNSISHKQQFWHVLSLLYNCDTCNGNNKLPYYYMTTGISALSCMYRAKNVGCFFHCTFTRLIYLHCLVTTEHVRLRTHAKSHCPYEQFYWMGFFCEMKAWICIVRIALIHFSHTLQ